MGAGARNIRPKRGRFGDRENKGLDGEEFQVGDGLRTALEPVEGDRVLVSGGHVYHTRTLVKPRGRQMRVSYERLPYMAEVVSGVFVAVEMQEGGGEDRRHEGYQNLDGEVAAH